MFLLDKKQLVPGIRKKISSPEEHLTFQAFQLGKLTNTPTQHRMQGKTQ